MSELIDTTALTEAPARVAMADDMLHRAKLFNPEGTDEVTERKMIGGNSTNILQLNNVKYSWTLKLKSAMIGNFWIPQRTSLQSDRFADMTKDQQETFTGILSFLIFLDSIQTANVPNIAEYITAPEVKVLMAIQTYQEAIHADSYQYIIESVIPRNLRDGIYDRWRDDPILFERNKLIAGEFQTFLDNPTHHGFKRVLVANLLLEGVYFQAGFQFFYLLASQGLMTGTSRIIKLIHKDETTHVTLFRNILLDVLTADDRGWVTEMVDAAVRADIKWSNHVIGDRSLGMSTESHEQYAKHLGNRRLTSLNMPALYTGVDTNPYKHLEDRADVEGRGKSKGSFFTDSAAYNQASALGGFDRF